MAPVTNQELAEHNRNRRIHQIAWVTRDLDKSLEAWVEHLKVGPWRVYRFNDRTVKGLAVGGVPVDEPFEFRIAISWIGDTEIELIQPVHGPTIYQRFIDEKGEGLHHVKERIADADMDATVAGYGARGIGVTQTGWFFRDVHAYLDTEPKLGFIYELGNCPAQDLPADAFTIYPPETAS
jgi:methylmalonyl-CoA/ethylmalonyl-CoA epimerase